MTIKFNHTIVWARDSQASATFLADVLGLPAPKRWGPFLVVTTDNGTNLDFMDVDGEIAPQHYAFSSPKQSSTKFLVGFGHDRFPIGPIPPKRSRARSTITTMGVVSISKIPTVTS
jgi:catechol 2,3-dioxygenase-like lactoylglutathione lyase family enzyme